MNWWSRIAQDEWRSSIPFIGNSTARGATRSWSCHLCNHARYVNNSHPHAFTAANCRQMMTFFVESPNLPLNCYLVQSSNIPLQDLLSFNRTSLTVQWSTMVFWKQWNRFFVNWFTPSTVLPLMVIEEGKWLIMVSKMRVMASLHRLDFNGLTEALTWASPKHFGSFWVEEEEE